jgi:hypothetical protein
MTLPTVLGTTASAGADELRQLVAPDAMVQPVLTSNCSGGVVYDDGVFNHAYSIGNGDPGDSTMVMRFDLPAGSTTLDQACLCFTRSSGEPSSMAFEVVVYDNDGPGGAPGTFLGGASATASSIPIFPSSQFYNVNLTGAGILLPNTSVYVGGVWPGGQRFLCGDRSTPTAQRTNYGSANEGATWTNLTTLFPENPSAGTGPPRALGVRVDAATGGGACSPSATAMCLNDNRFRVSATHEAPGQPIGNAQVVKLTDDTGYLWFFSATNVEAVVKVLNACGLNNRYWVFAGGLTNVRTVITVTDTDTGAVKTYTNPQGTAFQPIQDTSAFATCP